MVTDNMVGCKYNPCSSRILIKIKIALAKSGIPWYTLFEGTSADTLFVSALA
jgi:hypothetical protein